jgi:DNA-binding MarR family transcriptional regulator
MKSNTALTDEQVIEIRKCYAEGGIFQRELAEIFNTDQGSVSRIVSREIRRHL